MSSMSIIIGSHRIVPCSDTGFEIECCGTVTGSGTITRRRRMSKIQATVRGGIQKLFGRGVTVTTLLFLVYLSLLLFSHSPADDSKKNNHHTNTTNHRTQNNFVADIIIIIIIIYRRRLSIIPSGIIIIFVTILGRRLVRRRLSKVVGEMIVDDIVIYRIDVIQKR